MSPPSHHQSVAKSRRRFAKTLRATQTTPESAMWKLLRDRRLAGYKFRRQAPLGRYTVDFVCFERKLVVETDGSQHFESSRDLERDAFLRERGFRVLRYWNNDVLQRKQSVLEHIFAHLRGLED
jgi:very-short-patch-repair endonuclease